MRGKFKFDVVAWDDQDSSVPMRATRSPQEAINDGLPRPSECELVLTLFWTRMGTPLPYPQYQKPDGSQYDSGTEWEFHDALLSNQNQGKPDIFLYRRTERPLLSDSDPDFDVKISQRKL